MIDLGNMLLLAAVVFVLVETLSRMAPGVMLSKYKIPIVFGLSVVAVFLVSASSTFAHTQIVAGVPLDKVDVATKFLVALFLMALSVGINIVVPGTIKAIANIGSNTPDQGKLP